MEWTISSKQLKCCCELPCKISINKGRNNAFRVQILYIYNLVTFIFFKIRGPKDQLIDERKVPAKFKMRLRASFFIDGQRIQDETPSLRQRTVLYFHIGRLHDHACSGVLITAFAHYLTKGIFDSVVPEI